MTEAEPGAWRILERRRTVLSPYVTLCERVVLRTGESQPQIYHSIDQADYVSVLARSVAGEFVLVRQFRSAVESMTLELPSGLLDAGEDPAVCAARELEEETGYRRSAPLTFIGRIAPDVGRLDNALWAYYADRVEPMSGWTPEPGVTPVLLGCEEFLAVVARGELVNAPHLGLIAMARAQGLF